MSRVYSGLSDIYGNHAVHCEAKEDSVNLAHAAYRLSPVLSPGALVAVYSAR